jgi:molecular chaperone DnaJ
MAKRDYYDVLGVGRSASPDDLKSAFRKLAKELHPDRNPGDKASEAKFKELNEAYDVLKDEQKRAAYDQFGHAAFEGGGAGRGGGFDFSSSFADVFDDLFGEFMGRGGQRAGGSGALRGADLRFNLEISLEESALGKKAQIRVPTAITCEGCEGSGAAEGSKPVVCPRCRGVGQIRTQQGFFTVQRTCPTCHGQGRVIEEPCRKCGGQGRVQREKTLSVNVPPGVDDGTRIRLAGEGEAGMRGGPNGDLYIFLSVAPHRLFRRDGLNLYCRVPISMVSAALGGQIEVPTLGGGRAKVTVPAGTQTGKQFRLKAKGMPAMRSGEIGDLFIQMVIETPVNLTKRQKELLKEFEAAGTEEQTNPETSGFFAKVKEFWDDLRE